MREVRVRTLAQLLDGLEVELRGAPETGICGISHDSRRVQEGFLFAAIRGERTDGLRYAADARRRGAVALLTDRETEVPYPAIIRVPHVRAALSRIAGRFYGEPSRELRVIGVTGTKGKTTTALLLRSIYAAAEGDAGYIGTLGAFSERKRYATPPTTTPEGDDLQALLAQMRADGLRTVVLEVSSHGLKLRKVDGVWFARALFLNLSRDHLDFHSSMEDYYQSKRRLFTEVPHQADWKGFVYLEDAYGQRLYREVPGLVGVGQREGEIRVRQMEVDAEGLEVELERCGERLRLRSALLGSFNAWNVLMAGAAAWEDVGRKAVQEGVARVRQVPGRLEPVKEGQPFRVFVDYAHTPDSLWVLLYTVRRLFPGGHLTLLFGCGGDRDRTKRGPMGRIAVEFADRVVLTSDNPRHEDPDAILRDILRGIPLRYAKKVRVIPDRGEAIRVALREARAGDLVLIAGKGHETYQLVGDQRIPFDDREVARSALREVGYGLDD